VTARFFLATCLAYYLSLKMETTYSAATSVNFCRSIRWRIPDRITCCNLRTRASWWLLACLTLWPWRWRQSVLPKRRWNFTGVHGVASQNIELAAFASLCFLGTTSLAYSSILNLEAQYSSEKSANFYRSTLCHIRGNRTCYILRPSASCWVFV
jgi:hypothetical protein